jgi:hypothetical protein
MAGDARRIPGCDAQPFRNVEQGQAARPDRSRLCDGSADHPRNGVKPTYAGRLGDDPGPDLFTALLACTINAAHSLGMEAKVGSITPGKRADLIVIDRDLFQTVPRTISDVRSC